MTRCRVMFAALCAVLLACGDESGEQLHAPPSSSERLLVTAGTLQAGNPVQHQSFNPLAQDAGAAARGRQLYTWFNCAGCHGARGGGGMGPPLLDDAWIYGNDPASIFQTIAQGRPNGMPAFGGNIPDEDIWSLELFIRTLGGSDTTTRAGGSSGMSPTEAQRRTGGDD